MRRRFGIRLAVSAALCFLTLASAHAQTQVRSGFNIFTPDQDAQIGAQSAAQVDRQIPLVSESSAASRYVAALGARLAAQAPGPHFNYRFRVANLSDVNAFALPGGYVYVHRGLIENARSEGELAGVISHEIAHVALRHPTNQVSKAYLAQAGVGILGGLLGGRSHGGGGGQILSALGGLGLNTLFLKFSRTAESQADIVGAQIMARAGYDPNDLATFFTHMEQTANRNPSKVAVFLSDHPAPADREARVRQEARLIGGVRRGSNVGSLALAQNELRGLGAAPSMSQVASRTAPGGTGSTASIPQPASSYRIFRQPAGLFEIEQPSNWSAYSSSSGYGVTFAPPGGIVSGSNGRQGVAVGVIVNHYVPFEGSIGAGYGGSLTSATMDLVQQIQQGNPNLRRVSGSDRRLTLSGRPSYSTVLAGSSTTSGAEERITVVTSQLPDEHIIYLLLVGRQEDYTALSPAFDHMIRSLRVNEAARHD